MGYGDGFSVHSVSDISGGGLNTSQVRALITDTISGRDTKLTWLPAFPEAPKTGDTNIFPQDAPATFRTPRSNTDDLSAAAEGDVAVYDGTHWRRVYQFGSMEAVMQSLNVPVYAVRTAYDAGTLVRGGTQNLEVYLTTQNIAATNTQTLAQLVTANTLKRIDGEDGLTQLNNFKTATVPITYTPTTTGAGTSKTHVYTVRATDTKFRLIKTLTQTRRTARVRHFAIDILRGELSATFKHFCLDTRNPAANMAENDDNNKLIGVTAKIENNTLTVANAGYLGAEGDFYGWA